METTLQYRKDSCMRATESGSKQATVFPTNENTADEGISVFRDLLKINELDAKPLLNIELLQLRGVAQRSKALQCSIHLVLSLVFEHQHSEAQPAEHPSQTFCKQYTGLVD
ncbi:hypothetical protein INR49_000343 [Caranx melampygus]|nr:hypothetical protein INR49_000343 [Caranx melampygus]